jgi:hypothetical protein
MGLLVQRYRSSRPALARFEPFESGCNPAGPVDRAIMATRNAVFRLHGLMPCNQQPQMSDREPAATVPHTRIEQSATASRGH